MINVINLTKRLNNKTILNNTNMIVRKGEIHGLVGNEGSGKTTLLRILAGLIEPSSGSVLVDEQKAYERPATKRKVIMVPDSPYFITTKNLSALATFYAKIYKDYDKLAFQRLLIQFNLPQNINLNKFTKMEQRITALIIALCCRPKYLILDDFFEGMNQETKAKISGVLKSFCEDSNMGIIVSASDVNNITNLCNSMSLQNEGSLTSYSSLTEGQKVEIGGNKC